MILGMGVGSESLEDGGWRRLHVALGKARLEAVCDRFGRCNLGPDPEAVESFGGLVGGAASTKGVEDDVSGFC
jgi:hypothetical protein